MLQLNTSRCLHATVLLIIFVAVNGTEWIIERVQVVEFKQNYLKNISLNLISYSRRKRVINFYTEILITMDNNITNLSFLYHYTLGFLFWRQYIGHNIAMLKWSVVIKRTESLALHKVSNEYEEFINNEYRPVFVGLRFKLCEFIEAPYVMIKQKFGLQCPILPNKYSLYNLTVRWDLIPNFFPFKRGRVISTFLFTETKKVIAVIVFYTRVL